MVVISADLEHLPGLCYYCAGGVGFVCGVIMCYNGEYWDVAMHIARKSESIQRQSNGGSLEVCIRKFIFSCLVKFSGGC